jgi:hypothetical protein
VIPKCCRQLRVDTTPAGDAGDQEARWRTPSGLASVRAEEIRPSRQSWFKRRREDPVAGDASEALGAAEVAGTFVSAKGLTKRMAAVATGGVVGGVVGGMAAQAVNTARRYEGAPDFGTTGYVAVTADEVAIVRAKTGLMKPKVGSEVVARAPRTEVTSAELEKGALKAALKIEFVDGSRDEPRTSRCDRPRAR